MDIEDMTQNPLQDEGTFRVFPISWTVEKMGSGAVAIAYRLGISQKWHGKEQGWSQEWPVGYFVENRSWVVKKDQTLNTSLIENLSKCGLWNGDWDAFAGPCPTGFFILADVSAETWEGKVRYRADWLNPNADEPTARGGFAPVSESLLASLRTRFQSQTRAAIGGDAAGAAVAPPTPPSPHQSTASAGPAPAGPAGAPATPASPPAGPPAGAAPGGPGPPVTGGASGPPGPSPQIPGGAPAPSPHGDPIAPDDPPF